MINSMSYHFIRHKPTSGMLTMVNQSAKPMYMCFRDKQCADRCRTHFAKFKHDHGSWPSIDLSEYKEVAVETSNDDNKFPLSYIYNQLEIDTIQEEDLFDLGNTTGISFMYCHNFGIVSEGFGKMNVMFSGQEIELDAEYGKFIDWMEGHRSG